MKSRSLDEQPVSFLLAELFSASSHRSLKESEGHLQSTPSV